MRMTINKWHTFKVCCFFVWCYDISRNWFIPYLESVVLTPITCSLSPIAVCVQGIKMQLWLLEPLLFFLPPLRIVYVLGTISTDKWNFSYAQSVFWEWKAKSFSIIFSGPSKVTAITASTGSYSPWDRNISPCLCPPPAPTWMLYHMFPPVFAKAKTADALGCWLLQRRHVLIGHTSFCLSSRGPTEDCSRFERQFPPYSLPPFHGLHHSLHPELTVSRRPLLLLFYLKAT